MKCRFCSSENLNLFIDLGMSPPSNSFLTVEQLNSPEVYFPLKLWIFGRLQTKRNISPPKNL